MCNLCESGMMERRDFIKTASVTAAGISMVSSKLWAGNPAGSKKNEKNSPTVYGAFIYPPSEKLKKKAITAGLVPVSMQKVGSSNT